MSMSGESDRGNSRQSILCACLPKTSTRHGSEPLLLAALVPLAWARDDLSIGLEDGPRSAHTLLSKSLEASMLSMRVKTCSDFDYYYAALASLVLVDVYSS